MARATGTGGHCHLRARDVASGRISLTLSPGITAVRELFRRATRSRLAPGSRTGANCPLRRHPTTRALPAQSGSEQEQGDENAADPREKWQCRHWPSEEGDHQCKASEHGCRNDRALARPDIRAHQCMALRRRWHRRRLRTDQPGRHVSGEGAQVRIGPRREHRPTRRSNSSLARRPCTNAALSTSITCSRSACEARRWLWPPAPAATSSPGPTVTGTFHEHDLEKA
jgi:hypothetical protein